MDSQDRSLDTVEPNITATQKVGPALLKTGKVIARGKWVELRDTSPYWQIVFSLFGKRLSKSSATRNKREAEKMAKMLRDDMTDRHVRVHGKRGVPTKQRDTTLLGAVEWFWKHVGCEDGDASDTRRRLFNIVDVIGGGTMLSDITDERVVEAIKALEKLDYFGDPSRGKLTDSRVNTHVKTLRRLMLHASNIRKFYLPDMPDWPRHVIVFRPRKREASISELDTIVNSWRMDMRPALLFLFESGLRLRNAVELTWSQIDWDNSVITVAVKAPKGRKSRRARDTGNSRKPREVIITPAIRAILEEQIGKHPEAVFTFMPTSTRNCPKTGARRIRGQYLPMKAVSFGTYWRRIRQKCSVSDLRIHDLRRTRGSWLYRATGDIKLVKEFLHHADIRITESTYAHVATEQLVQGVLRMRAYEDDLRSRFGARTGAKPAVQGEFAGEATEEDPAKGVSLCQEMRNAPASATHLHPNTSIERTKEILRRLEINPRFQREILTESTSGGIAGENTGCPGSAQNRTLQKVNCRKIAEANSGSEILDGASNAGPVASRFAQSCEPYLDDPAFLASFVVALDRCFATVASAKPGLA